MDSSSYQHFAGEEFTEILKRRPELSIIAYDRDNPIDVLLIRRYDEYMIEIENIDGYCFKYETLDIVIDHKRGLLHALTREHDRLPGLVELFAGRSEAILVHQAGKCCCVLQ